MVKKKEKAVEVSTEDENNRVEPWDPFRVPAHLESVVLDSPWVHPWMQRRGWRDL